MKRFPMGLLLSMVATSTIGSIAPARLPIINDDYEVARATAVRRHVPVFVEVWAPW